ncbi:MAG: hypothetical protein GKC53_06210 [Neisseriaceae bacterium]|nr:MAG: hypothetical protein GKC53_06210 [Neisseriaceae bacterium]
MAKDVYESILLGGLIAIKINSKNINIQHRLNDLIKKYPNIPFIKNKYYYFLNENKVQLSSDDIKKIKHELITDFRSVIKKKLLMKHYIAHEQLDEAKKLLHSIPRKDINNDSELTEISNQIDIFYTQT